MSNVEQDIIRLEAAIENIRGMNKLQFETIDKKIDDKFNGVDEKIDKMSNTFSWAARLFSGAIILGVAAFILQGGLKSVGG